MASLCGPRWPRSHLKWALVGNQLFTQNDFEVRVHASSCGGLAPQEGWLTLVQYTHWYGLSPEWTRMCLFRLEDCEKLFPHVEH